MGNGWWRSPARQGRSSYGVGIKPWAFAGAVKVTRTAKFIGVRTLNESYSIDCYRDIFGYPFISEDFNNVQ